MTPNAKLVRRAALAILVAATMGTLAACHDTERASVAAPIPTPLPVSASAFLLVSDTLARAGGEVTIAAYAKSDTAGAVGSFTARFLYDALQLQVISADSVGDNVLRAVNPVSGEYRIGGASAKGIPAGLLFRLRVKVLDPRGLRRLGLLVDEMHSVAFADLAAKLQVNDTRQALLSTMPGTSVGPRKVRPQETEKEERRP